MSAIDAAITPDTPEDKKDEEEASSPDKVDE